MTTRPRRAIVTGAASAAGIGFAIARALAAEGWSLVLTDIDEGAVEARAADLAREGADATGLAQDIADATGWDTVFAAATAKGGRVDALVNNAALAILKPLGALSPEELLRLATVNLVGTQLGCRAALAAMAADGAGGAIVNIGSVSALTGFVGNAGYGATKGAIAALGRHVAIEGAPHGVTCNTVFPGAIWTDIQRRAHRDNPAAFADVEQRIPLGRIGDPEDVAHMVAFLAGPRARYVTGAEFVVDGGLTSLSLLGA